MRRVAVIGAGPAGLMAAGQAARSGAQVFLFEQNEKAGKKIYLTGKGRCNVTNNKLPPDFLENVAVGKKFLFSALHRFTPEDTIHFFEAQNVPLKVERGDRVFPQSDKASDITKALISFCSQGGVEIIYDTKVNAISFFDDVFSLHTNRNSFTADAVILATGGKSYPATGSTGDGYRFVRPFGHTVSIPKPALVPILCSESFLAETEGLSLKNVTLSAEKNKKIIASEFGEMLFTARGISGPIALTLSSYLTHEEGEILLRIDFKPALDLQQLDARLLREFSENKNKNMATVMGHLLPSSFIGPFLKKANIEADKKIHSVTAAERAVISEFLKGFPLLFSGLDQLEYAIITSGGVSTSEVNPKTFESKLQKGLYFAGEVLDVDALTGGYNIQIALSTGFCAGIAAAKGE